MPEDGFSFDLRATLKETEALLPKGKFLLKNVCGVGELQRCKEGDITNTTVAAFDLCVRFSSIPLLLDHLQFADMIMLNNWLSSQNFGNRERRDMFQMQVALFLVLFSLYFILFTLLVISAIIGRCIVSATPQRTHGKINAHAGAGGHTCGTPSWSYLWPFFTIQIQIYTVEYI